MAPGPRPPSGFGVVTAEVCERLGVMIQWRGIPLRPVSLDSFEAIETIGSAASSRSKNWPSASMRNRGAESREPTAVRSG